VKQDQQRHTTLGAVHADFALGITVAVMVIFAAAYLLGAEPTDLLETGLSVAQSVLP
jgi:hypothetical protein